MGVMGESRTGMTAHAFALARTLVEKIDTQLNVLRSIREVLETQPDTIAVTDTEADPGFEIDFPFKGARRATIRRTPDGDERVIPANGAQLLKANNRRLGGSIVNQGAAGVSLILGSGDGSITGRGQIWIGPGGGSWDFRVGNLLWCGAVWAVPDSGTPTVSWVEV